MFTKAFMAAALVGLAASSPLRSRQTRSSSSEFSQGGCKPVMFAFARGSTEIGNMGTVVGPQTSDGLKANFGADQVATEGIEYAAALAPNALPGGTDEKSKQSMQDTLNAMASQCADSVIVAGGYSQGAAVSHRAIESLDPAVQDQIAGVILYGDTQKQQDNNQIPNFPQEKTMIICQPGDLVCVGTLTILPAHLTYGQRADEGVQFLTTQVQGAMARIKARKVKRESEDREKRQEEELREQQEELAEEEQEQAEEDQEQQDEQQDGAQGVQEEQQEAQNEQQEEQQEELDEQKEEELEARATKKPKKTGSVGQLKREPAKKPKKTGSVGQLKREAAKKKPKKTGGVGQLKREAAKKPKKTGGVGQLKRDTINMGSKMARTGVKIMA